MRRCCIVVITCVALALVSASGRRSAAQSLPSHPNLLFDDAELDAIRVRAASARMLPYYNRLVARANALLRAAPILVSTTGRGEADPPGTVKGLTAARRLQGRVVTFALTFLLTGNANFKDAAVAQLDHAITNWPIWVDTAHQPPYDLMTGEVALTFGLAYDWLHPYLSEAERTRLREGVERRALAPYLQAADTPRPMFWLRAEHNWNPVCNGGAAVLALALRGDSALPDRVLEFAVPSMEHYWNNLGDDGGWEEGTGYWTYGHRYAFMAADALRRAGWDAGAQYLAREGARRTGGFPLVFNPGTRLSASFSDSADRAADPLFYYLGREYLDPDYIWFQDRVPLRSATSEGWPEESLTLIWRPVDQAWLPEAYGSFRPTIPAVTSFPSIGWAMLASEQPDPPVFLAFKNGSLAANHSHLDLNHVSLGMGDNMLLVDLGSRPYPADYFSASARPNYYEISTAGHNSVLVGGRGQVFGRTGTLRGPFEGARYSAFLGIAGGSYQISTPRARRHVVFVDRRYYVLLDEVAPQTAQNVELRFHTYGTIATAPRGTGWTVNQSGSQLDVAPASSSLIRGTIETPSGWIRQVNLLRMATPGTVSSLTLATALVPRTRASATFPQVSQQVRGSNLVVTLDGDQVTFLQTADGYVLSGVTIAQRP